MLVAGFPAGSFQTNCYVAATGPGAACVVVDPGQDAVTPLDALLAEHRLTPVAVLLTHGHFDHTFSVVPVCDGHDVPAWIHPDDRSLLADPLKGLSREAAAFFGGRIELREPRAVRELVDGADLELAGLTLRVEHTPGHTPGSVIFSMPAEDGVEVIIAGDTLFAGSIGRTDLPGGDHEQMMASLRDKLLAHDDSAVVLPGHGPRTTVGRERRSNPFLQGLGDGGRVRIGRAVADEEPSGPDVDRGRRPAPGRGL